MSAGFLAGSTRALASDDVSIEHVLAAGRQATMERHYPQAKPRLNWRVKSPHILELKCGATLNVSVHGDPPGTA